MESTGEFSQSETAVSKPEQKTTPREILLVFGQGPVVDSTTRLKASEAQNPPGQEDINLWSKTLAESAKVLLKKRVIKEIVVMGGKTGGSEYASEAELIAKQMAADGIPQEGIKLEKESLDTIENIVNFLNFYDEGGNKKGRFDILSTSYHASRLRVLLKLFNIPIRHIFVSDEVLRYAARTEKNTLATTTDSSLWDQQQLALIEHKLDSNNLNNFYSQQRGTESRDVQDRLVTDDILTRELLEFPEKWLSQVGRVENDQRLNDILEGVEKLYPALLSQKYGIDNSESLPTIREKLKKITYTPLSLETFKQWVQAGKEGKGWPPETLQKLERLINTS